MDLKSRIFSNWDLNFVLVVAKGRQEFHLWLEFPVVKITLSSWHSLTQSTQLKERFSSKLSSVVFKSRSFPFGLFSRFVIAN
jgi:hypothetical protein